MGTNRLVAFCQWIGAVNLRNNQTVYEVLVERAHERADHPLAVFLDEHVTLSYQDALARTRSLATGLSGLAVKPGDKIAIYLPNTSAALIAWYAALAGGFVSVAVNPELQGHMLAYAIEKADVSVVVTNPSGVAALAEIDTLRTTHVIVAGDGPVGAIPGTNVVSLEEVERSADPGDVSCLGRTSAADPASIYFTSGTTGPPKGVLMSNGHMLASASMFGHLTEFSRDDVLYTCFPSHHVFGSVTGALAAMCGGGTAVVSPRFSASRYWSEIIESGATVAHMLDPLVPLLMKRPESEDDRAHALRIMYTTGKHYPAFEERFGVPILTIFDMSELTVPLYYPRNEPSQADRCGKESGLFDVRVVDDHDREVPVGEEGQIVVRPRQPNLMLLGYYNDAEGTVARWQNLWFHTGDLAIRHPDGYFEFRSRMGDRIRRRGVNVSADQLEQVANTHESVLEAAVIAVPSDISEDDIKICVTPRPGSTIKPEELLTFLEKELPRALVPRYAEIRAEMPKTYTEKIQRQVLRAEGDRGLTPTTWDAEREAFLGDAFEATA